MIYNAIGYEIEKSEKNKGHEGLKANVLSEGDQDTWDRSEGKKRRITLNREWCRHRGSRLAVN